MSNSSDLFSYTTICSSFKWIEPLFFELSCTQTHTHTDTETHTHRNTDGHEYSIVAVEYYLNYLSIVKSIPEEWKKKLQENNTESKISISDEFLGPAGVKHLKIYTIPYLCMTISVLPSKNLQTILNFER